MALQPVVLVAVRRADQVLLVRHVASQPHVWALIGGIVEAGESLEDAARREVAEEVGLGIGDLTYTGSEPWGSPHLLLAAFTAWHVSGEPACDPTELTEARWFPIDHPSRPTPTRPFDRIPAPGQPVAAPKRPRDAGHGLVRVTVSSPTPAASTS